MKAKEKALLVAERAHSAQTYDIFPYIYHVKMVAQIAEDLGYEETIVVAAVLHDTLEDTALSYNDLLKAFGEEVAEIVYAVTDELGRNRLERKSKTYPKIRANWKAAAVKICDRIANIQHSKEYTPKLLEMYKKEHQDFHTHIESPDHPFNELRKAWTTLDILISGI